MTSHNPNDEREGFCGNCHAWTAELESVPVVTDTPEVKVVDLAFEGTILPPAPEVCQVCAVEHDPSWPHDQQSLFYQYAFYHDNFRWPTWADAMAHCAPSMREFWREKLSEWGVPREQLYAGA